MFSLLNKETPSVYNKTFRFIQRQHLNPFFSNASMKTQRRLNDYVISFRNFPVVLNKKVVTFWALSCCIFGGQAILFCLGRPHKLRVILACLPFVLFFSLVALPMVRGVAFTGVAICKRCNRILSCFLLFFLTALGYMVLASLTVSLPMGWILGNIGFSHDAINGFSLQTSNCALALALLTWLHFLPKILRNDGRLAVSM